MAMATISAFKELKEQIEKEARAKIDKGIEELKEIGLHYELTEGKSGKAKGFVGDKECPTCKFKTDPPHDDRKHRGQTLKGDKKKKKFTDAELKELRLTKVT